MNNLTGKFKFSFGVKIQTSRFPYIGSWCVLFAVLAQYVMAAALYAFKLSLSTLH